MSAPRRRLTALVASAALLPAVALLTGPAASAATTASARHDAVKVPASLRSAAPATGLAPALRGSSGTVSVSVRLSEAPVAEVVEDGAVASRTLPPAATQKARVAAVRSQQDALAKRAGALGAKVTGRAVRAANLLTMTVPASRLADLAKLPGVLSVKPVGRYETTSGPAASGSLAQAVDYLGARALHRRGIDGSGVSIAVLDSGIDYTHANLGGPGTTAAWENCYDSPTNPQAFRRAAAGACAKLFGPSAPKVKGGYDFVGESWPGTANNPVAERPDPNPIDLEGHGTHVADIATGRSADGSHVGLAPGADLYAVKVCSAVATSCSGVAIIQGIDWSLDPNGDGDISDAVDIMNLSLGSSYGGPQDDATVAIDGAVRAGVLAVVSAGNSADRPFIVGSPSTAARAVSVAQTALPDDVSYPVRVDSPAIPGLPDNTVRYTVFQEWSPALTAPVTGDLATPSDADGLGCTAADFAGFPAGAVALIQRGACNASLKASNASAAGASAALIYNNVPGDPPSFSFGDGVVTVPTLTMSQERGQQLAAAAADGTVTVTIDPADAISLANTMVGTSSRGPRLADELTKPDIGAPGAWLSAEVGTGDEETNFGGTSGAAPTVTGVAALLLQAYPRSTPTMVKSRLLNGASTQNATLDGDANRYPSPISRVGAGEVRADASARPRGILVNAQTGNGNIGLGLPHLTRRTSFEQQVVVRNYSTAARTYALGTTFRDPADAALGALTVKLPRSVTVPAGTSRTVDLRITIDPAKLPRWPFTNTAGSTGDGTALNGPELDGYVTATWGDEQLHLGWQVLPQRSADVSASATTNGPRTTVRLRNASKVADGPVDVYGLTGSSPQQPAPRPGEPGSAGSNQAQVDLASVGVADFLTGDPDADVLAFALAGYDRQTVPAYPAGYEVDVDTDRDGTADFAVFNSELGGFATTGQTAAVVVDLATGEQNAYYYTIGDFDSSTIVYYVPPAALGLEAGDTFDFSVLAYDNYFSGTVTDVVDGMTWTLGSSRFDLTGATVTVPAGGRGTVTVRTDASAGPSSESGLLLLYGTAKSRDSQEVRITG